MTAEIIDGKAIAAQIEAELVDEIAALKRKSIIPGLAVILVGDDPASRVYVGMKGKACERLGLYHETLEKPAGTTEDEILATIKKLNGDMNVHGILVQLPLPAHIDEERVLLAISPEKDVDGFHPVNVGRMTIGKPGFLPCTPHGVQQLLVRTGHNPAGKHVVIVGRSNIVGKPLANIFIQKAEGANATVTTCHSRTPDLAHHTRQADILIAAIGVPEFIKADMVKDGAVVVDVGVNRVEDASAKRGYRLVGDVDFEAVKEKAAAITPVPGGVGPMTIVMLMKNTITAARTLGEARVGEL